MIHSSTISLLVEQVVKENITDVTRQDITDIKIAEVAFGSFW